MRCTLASTNDGNDETVTVPKNYEFFFNYKFNQAKADGKSDGFEFNSTWITKLNNAAASNSSETENNEGSANNAGVNKTGAAIAAIGMFLADSKESLDGTTYRLLNKKGTNFSPRFYGNGWGGGSAGQIKTYSVSKTIGVAGKTVGWVGVFYSGFSMYSGDRDAVGGTADIGMGLYGIFGGLPGAVGSLSYELGKLYGPSKWYGSNDSKWFE